MPQMTSLNRFVCVRNPTNLEPIRVILHFYNIGFLRVLSINENELWHTRYSCPSANNTRGSAAGFLRFQHAWHPFGVCNEGLSFYFSILCAGAMLIKAKPSFLLSLLLLFSLWNGTQGRCSSCPSNGCSQTGMSQG